ncbi:MAG: hypothetical protein AAF228_01015 [Pseudomonadota bacterium]
MINTAAQSALSGLQSASSLFSQAATNIVQAPTQTFVEPLSPVTSSFPNGGPALQNVSALNQVIGENPGLAENLVTLQEASFAYQASANVLGSIQETSEEVLERVNAD